MGCNVNLKEKHFTIVLSRNTVQIPVTNVMLDLCFGPGLSSVSIFSNKKGYKPVLLTIL